MIDTYGRPSWGAETVDATRASPSTAWVSLLPVAAEAASALQDPRRQVETLAVKEQWARSHGLMLIADLYKARLNAAQQRLALTQESESRTRSWSQLGRTGISVGIVSGVALTVLLLALAFNVSQRK